MKTIIVLSLVIGFAVGIGSGIMYCGANPVIRYVENTKDSECDCPYPQKESVGIFLNDEKECPACECPKAVSKGCVWSVAPGCKVE